MRAHSVARLRRGLCAAQPQRGAAELGAMPLRQSSPFLPLRLALLDDEEGRLKTNRGSIANGVKFRSECFTLPLVQRRATECGRGQSARTV